MSVCHTASMKKIVISLIAVIVFATSANAQKFGVQVSYLHDKTTWKSLMNEPFWSNLSSGLSAGLSYDFRITDKIHIEPGLQLRLATAVSDLQKVIDYWGSISSNFKYNDSAFLAAFPINFKYNIMTLEDNSTFTLIAGPRFNYGLVSEKEYRDENLEYSLDDYEDLGVNRFNMTFGIGIGFDERHNGYYIGYDFGLLHKQSEETVLTNNNMFYVNYIYYF